MIYTASYFAPDCHHGQRLSISRSIPKGVEVDGIIPALHPSADLLRWWKSSAQDEVAWGQYARTYWAELADRRQLVEDWLASLDEIDRTLLCWEGSDARCHRSHVGRLIQKRRPDLWGGEGVLRQVVFSPASLLPAPTPAPTPVVECDLSAHVQVGDLVRWKECPPYIKSFEVGRVSAIDSERQKLKLGFIHHWVPIADCEWAIDSAHGEFWKLYGGRSR